MPRLLNVKLLFAVNCQFHRWQGKRRQCFCILCGRWIKLDDIFLLCIFFIRLNSDCELNLHSHNATFQCPIQWSDAARVAIAQLKSNLFINFQVLTDRLNGNLRALTTSGNMFKDRQATVGLFTLSNECQNISFQNMCLLGSPCFSPVNFTLC